MVDPNETCDLGRLAGNRFAGADGSELRQFVVSADGVRCAVGCHREDDASYVYPAGEVLGNLNWIHRLKSHGGYFRSKKKRSRKSRSIDRSIDRETRD